MAPQFIIAIIWLTGYFLSFWMLKVEHDASKQQWTYGDKAAQAILSVLSWVMALFLVAKAWVFQVDEYWQKPIEKKKATE